MDHPRSLPVITADGVVLAASALRADTTDFFATDDVTFQIASSGARILDLRYRGTPLMHPPHDPARYGSTFWPSPQSVWKWPPMEALHKGQYRINAGDVSVEAVSDRDPQTGLRAIKRFSRGPVLDSVRMLYTLENAGAAHAKWAPWEITQLLPGGLVFFPGSVDPSRNKNNFVVPDFEEHHGVLWRNVGAPPGSATGLAIGTSSEGWIAYARDCVLMMKVFEVVPQERHAPGEGQVELFFDGDGAFWEMEVQGAYEEIPPGGRIEMEVVWAFVALEQPAEMMPRERLLALARRFNC